MKRRHCVTVRETVVRTSHYLIDADSVQEAEQKALKGETEKEIPGGFDEVINRELESTTAK